MSCQDCDKLQDSNMTSYFRWKNANIEIRGCKKHLKEVFEALRKAQIKGVAKPTKEVE